MATTFERTSQYDAANGILSVLVTGTSDGVNDSAASLITKSAFKGLDGTEPAQIKILRITSSMQGYSSLRVYFDSTVDRTIARLAPGSCYLTWSRFAGLAPLDLGAPGNVLIDTTGAVNGGSFTLQIEAQLVD